MKNMILKLNNWKFSILITTIIIVIIGILGGVFYWYQIRPTRIYSKCDYASRMLAMDYYKSVYPYKTSEISQGMYLVENYESYYKQCLRSKGINK